MVVVSRSKQNIGCSELFSEYHTEKRFQVVLQLSNSLPILLLDLLTVEPHTRTPEPVKYEKKDGQWYTHDGVDVKETQSRKGLYCCN